MDYKRHDSKNKKDKRTINKVDNDTSKSVRKGCYLPNYPIYHTIECIIVTYKKDKNAIYDQKEGKNDEEVLTMNYGRYKKD